MAIRITQRGDVLDQICHEIYGKVNSEILSQVLEANQDLSDSGVIFEEGIEIILPDELLNTQTERRIRLWD